METSSVDTALGLYIACRKVLELFCDGLLPLSELPQAAPGIVENMLKAELHLDQHVIELRDIERRRAG